jgi:FtsZ-interacting cell division protein YlmF
MGLFKWAMKGVKAEKGADKDDTAASVSDLQSSMNDMIMDMRKEAAAATEKLTDIEKEKEDESAEDIVETVLDEGEQTPKDMAASVLFNFNAPSAAMPIIPEAGMNMNMGYGTNFANAFAGGTLGNRHILVTSPKTQPEIFAVVEHLKTNEAVIINFEGLPQAESQRFIDFLSGVSCALGGSISALDNFKYILTPSGVGVR